ncbi:hypothetical protein [Vibrio fluminensis]|nr:hypothetical protein [Vibrio fluminensis]
MRIKVIPVALLSSLISVPTFADVEHKFGFKGSYVDQDASHSMLFGK